MKAKIDGTDLVLSTGTRIDTSGTDVETISPGSNGYLSYGYDGEACTNKSTPLTLAEREEVAEYMIDVWRRWASEPDDSDV